MKLLKTASGKRTIKISKKEWRSIGKKAGWMASYEDSPDNLKAKKWMRQHKNEYVDEFGEVNMTQLAEDCAIALYDREAGEAEFEMAYEVAEEVSEHD